MVEYDNPRTYRAHNSEPRDDDVTDTSDRVLTQESIEMAFPQGFTWGAATASYQIEGACDADGKGPSVWDMLARQPGRTYEGHTGEPACDSYRRYAEDVALMREMGLKGYRFSISWPRVMPDGTGRVNEAGLGFYDRLVDGLLAAGVEPWPTLFHWDYPYELFKRGGWLNPDSSHWFSEYTRVIVDRLSDRVSNWMTLNEPQCFIGLGHLDGVHAPGLRLGMREVLLAAHNALLAHGRAASAIREHSKSAAKIGWAPVGVVHHPVTHSAADIEACRERVNAVDAGSLWNNRWWADPVILGHYPETGLRAYGADAPRCPSSDFDVMKQPLDFYGANVYTSTPTRAGAGGAAEKVPLKAGYPASLFNWPMTPEALYWGPKFLQEMYGLPIVITENGLSNVDWVSLDGHVHDPNRIDFTTRYLRELGRAIGDGVDIRGYFHWSLMDNFEWAEGHKQRFGMIHVDYETQKRTVKDSGHWYRGVIESNGASL